MPNVISNAKILLKIVGKTLQSAGKMFALALPLRGFARTWELASDTPAKRHPSDS